MNDLTLHRGESKKIPITIVDEESTPVNVTDCALSFVVASRVAEVLSLVDSAITKVDATNGEIEIVISPDDTRSLSVGSYKYELSLTDIEDNHYVALQGDFHILPSLSAVEVE